MTPAGHNRPMGISRLASLLAGTMAVLVGGGVLLGWALDIPALKSVLPGWVSMKPNTAVAFILTGIAVLLARPPLTSNPDKSRADPQHSISSFGVSRLVALLAGLIGLLTLSEYATGWSPGFDQWLFREPAGTVGTSNPGRMAPEAALCFVLLAAALWFINGSRKMQRSMIASTMLGLLVTTLAVGAMLSYFTPTLGAYGWWGLTIMAVPTAATFAVLGLAIMLITWQEHVWSWALGRKTTVAFASGLALFIVIGINSSRSVVRLNETNRWVAHTQLVLQTVTDIQAALAEAQTHTRGYVITAEERYLASKRSAAARCDRAMDILRQLTASDPRRQPVMMRLETQVKEALQWFQSVIDTNRAGMTDATRRQMVGHGEDLMVLLRTAFEEIESDEGRLLQQREQEAENVARFSFLVISGGTLASLVIFLGVLVELNRAEAGRNLAEGALRDTNEYLENLFKYANAPIIVWNAEGKITRFNHAFEEIAGLKAEEVLGKGLDLFFAEDERERAMGIVRRAGAGERFELVEVPIQHTSGIQRTVLWNSAPIFGPDKQKQIATIAQGQDISELKQAEAALRESEEQFRTMANSMSQLAWIARADGFIFWYNQRWYEYTGTTPEQMEGWGWQSVHDPKLLPKVMENWTRAIATGQPFEMEFPLRGADGQFRDFLTRGQPLKDAEGRVVQWFGTNTDVAALKGAEEVLRDANLLLEGRVAERTEELKRNRDDLAAANKELESFAYSVSHDLRAPLRSIDGFSRILLEDYATKLDEEGCDSLNRIRAATQRMAQLIDDLLNLSRVTRAEMQRERVDLSALTREVAAALRQQEPNRTVEFLVARGVVADGDPHLLRVALENLLGNAWKFTGRREGARIEFGTAQRDGQKNYFVRDNGAGFDAAYVGKLFSAFQRLHSSTEFPGTGIGLATVQRIVHRHGGRVWAEGAVDKGATFYFNLGSEPSSTPETS